MCKLPIHEFLQNLPKCEHHVHLEGTLEPDLLFRLAAKNNIALPADDPAFTSPETLVARYTRFTSLDDFLHYYYIGMSVLLTASDFEELAFSYFSHASRDGVHHAEVFFDPQAHLSRSIPYSEILSGFTSARQRAATSFPTPLTTDLILCFLRHIPVPETLSTFSDPAIQASFLSGAITGIGLDSSEKPFPPELFTELYARAADLKTLRLTAHAGEEGPAAYIAGALDTLHVTRIDHGIRLAEDEELLKRVARQGTMLTMCPVSNLYLKCVPEISALPVRKFLEAGVRFSINSDDPAYFGGNYCLANYCAVQEAFDLGVEEWRWICESGIRGSWCGEERKEELLARLEEVVGEWKAKGG